MKHLTYPWGKYGGDPISFPNVVCSEGIGKIHFNDTAGTVIGKNSVTVISENDKLLIKGSTHDQQDHGSITVNRNLSNDKNGIDRLIVDPGYPGFANKGEEAQFKWHNVITLDNVLRKDSITDTVNGSVFSRETTYTEIRPDGGIHSNTYAKWGEILDIVEDRFGTGNLTQNIINISALMVGLFGGADALTGNTFTPIVFTGLPILWLNSDMKTNIMNGAGGGRSELIKQYSCGMTVRTHYDVDSSYWDRTVINYGSNVYVFDNVMSNATKTSIRFNLMEDSSITRINAKTFFSMPKNWETQFCISIFSQNSDDSDTIEFQKKIFAQNGTDSLHIFKLSLTDSSKNGNFHSTKFLTQLEISSKDRDLNFLPIVKLTSPNEQIISSTHNDLAHYNRYIFINKDIYNGNDTLTIDNIKTDAKFGIIDINDDGSIRGGKLFGTTVLTLNDVIIRQTATIADEINIP